MEKPARSLMKSISFRIVATSTTMLLVFLFTRDLVASAGVGSIDFLAKIGIYYLHERMWNTSNFGRKESTANLSKETSLSQTSPLALDQDE